ncbi:MAG: hypothetical protein Q9190_004314 [Brigantiaea leucoxantha]
MSRCERLKSPDCPHVKRMAQRARTDKEQNLVEVTIGLRLVLARPEETQSFDKGYDDHCTRTPTGLGYPASDQAQADHSGAVCAAVPMEPGESYQGIALDEECGARFVEWSADVAPKQNAPLPHQAYFGQGDPPDVAMAAASGQQIR